MCNNQTAIHYYEAYKAFINSDNQDVDTLYYLFRKVESYSEFEMNNDDRLEVTKKTLEFINELDEENKRNLQQQLDDFVSNFQILYKKYYL